MRRILATSLAAALVASGAVACSNSDDTVSDKADEAISTAKEAASEAKEATSEAKEATDKASSDVLKVYSSRHYDTDKEVYEMFEKETGIKIDLVEGKSGELIERISREAGDAQADVFLTVGAESIAQLVDADAITKSTSPTIEKNIPDNYRGENWMGIVSRARVIAYDKDRTDPSLIKSYEDLTKPEWNGKVLARSSSNSYNQALLSSFISLWGKEKATEWAQGVVDNFAREPKGNDRDQAKAVVAGEGDLAIMNSYYLVRMAKSSDPEEVKVAEKIGLIFPEKTHVNLSYAAVLKGAEHQDNAIKFLEFLSSEKVQEFIAENNGEFPLNPAAPMPEMQKSWGEFTIQDLDFATFGEEKPEATLIFDQVGWK
ncbi:extracellular solute-binding protein [Corynebacterium mendelii]|uniref:Extracellular solute-binding protein n=1 Tax=Corynebacterium mendelii TaxID=2765362 RepID=A0A939IY63_9CORY|nr:extracellular solute-binding protein [Corynebacterium mendelii]MBN9644347.1 extracellular solute-binding protein [Corynebacterium mendelii]